MFVDYPFGAWGSASTGDYAYARNQDLTADEPTWLTGVEAMEVRYGGDEPESQYESLFQAATGAGRDVPPSGSSSGDVAAGQAISFRPDATKVIAITTDASFHDAGDPGGSFPYPGPSRDDTVAALNAAGIKVIAIKAPGSGGEMDDLANATGGAVTTTGSSSAEIVEAIVGALEELTFDITGKPVGCEPLDITFNPAVHAGVGGGTTVTFVEKIAVPAGTTEDEVSCKVQCLADDTVIGEQTVKVLINRPPDCSAVRATATSLWPPNHKMVPVSLGGATDPDGDLLAFTIDGVTQDEPVNGLGDGDTSPDAQLGQASNGLALRAERSGTGDGRVYRIAYTVSDPSGATCAGVVTVGVPHDQRPGATAVDSGGSFNSLTA